MRRFVAMLLSNFLAVAVGVALAPTQAPAAEEPPYQRVLTGDAAKRAAELDRQLDDLQAAAKFAEAVPPAEELLQLRQRVQGADHWETADARRTLATLRLLAGKSVEDQQAIASVARLQAAALRLIRRGQYSQAEPTLREVLAIRRRVLGDDHSDTAAAAIILAGNLGEQAKYTQAEPLLQKALAVQRQVLGEDHPNTAVAYNHVGSNLDDQGKHADAEPFYRRALDIRKNVLGEEHTSTAESYHNLASNLEDQGNYRAAEPLYRQALAVYLHKRGEEHADTATCYAGLATNLRYQGKFREAELLLRKVLAIRLKLQGDEHPDTASSLGNLADVLKAQSKYAEAGSLYQKALAVRRKVLGDDHPDTGQSYNDLAGNLRAQGKAAEAEPLQRKALAICLRALGEDHPNTASCISRLAAILEDQGGYDEAELLYRKVLEVRRRRLGEAHPETARAYNNLAANLDAQRKHAAAEPLFQKALAMRRKLLGDDHPATTTVRHNLALNLTEQGRYAEAEALHREALTVDLRTLGEEHADTALGYNNLALSLHYQGKYHEAEDLYRKALAIQQRAHGDHPDTVLTWFNLANNFHVQGRYAEAEPVWEQVARLYEVARLGVSAAGAGRAGYGAGHSPLPRLAACLVRTGKPAEAWSRLEANFARGLLDDYSARVARPLSPEERQRRLEWTSQIGRLDGQIATLLSKKEAADADRASLQELSRQRTDAQAGLARFAAELTAREVYDQKRIQALLPADVALVAWVDLKGESRANDPGSEHWACVLRRGGEAVWAKVAGGGPNGAWTPEDYALPERVRVALRQPPGKSADDWQAVTRRLAAQRLAPLEQALAGKGELPPVKHLIVLPSMHLAQIPLEALTDRYTVSYAPSATVLARLLESRPKKEPQSAGLLAVGDPNFTRPDKKEAFPALPGTRREVEALGRLVPQATLLLGSDASAGRLEELAAAGRLKEFRYLHFATHGVMNLRVALQSELVLAQDHVPDPAEPAPAGGPLRSGRLTAEYIQANWQLDAELVTLSACRSALGKYGGGDGFLGFAQALFVAGAHSLVLSLWKVDDAATALLMERFYENLLGRRSGDVSPRSTPLPKAEALREAKEWLRNLTAKEVDQVVARLPQVRGGERVKPLAASVPEHPYAHPYYWSAFILIGDPN